MKKAIIKFADGTTKTVECADEVYDFFEKGQTSALSFKFTRRKFVGINIFECARASKHINNPECDMPNCYKTQNWNEVCGFLKMTPEEQLGRPFCNKCFNKPAKRNGRWILKEVKQNDRR